MFSSEVAREIQHISSYASDQDISIIADHMQKLRDLKVTPNKTIERGVDFADRYVLQVYPNMDQLYRMALAVHLTTEAVKLVRFEKVHKEER